jgi:putative chitinase
MITAQQLAISTGAKLETAEKWLAPVVHTMDKYDINSKARMAAFLAQIGHETSGFQFIHELWGPTEAQKGYEFNKELGNTNEGDGYRYRGRGLIQVTGRFNYRMFGIVLLLPLEERPELLEVPENAALVSGLFWFKHRLNVKADYGDFKGITQVINGGLNGYANRVQLWEKAKGVL